MRRLLAAALLVAGAAGAWYFASPVHAMAQLRDAAAEGDAEALERQVDFPALREDLKRELRGQVTDGISADPGNPFAAIGAGVAMAVAGPVIDAFVTPRMVARLVREGDAGRPGEDDAGQGGGEADAAVEWTIRRDGWSRFTAMPVRADGSGGTGLEFARDGLRWRLVGVEMGGAGR